MTNFLNGGPVWDATLAGVNEILQALQKLATLANQQIELQDLKTILAWPTGPALGKFNPPANLVVLKPVEVFMSVLELEVGQTAGPGTMTFNEPTPPADGAVFSDNPAVCPISLAADGVTWTCGPALSVGVANMSYTGTSAPPDVGPVVVPNMVVTVVAVPVAEQGDFNPTGVQITGP
jgi:hypothetical protein